MKKCPICGSVHFLIEDKYSIFAFAAKGGFGAVYKTGNIKVKKKNFNFFILNFIINILNLNLNLFLFILLF
jgi:hypothetical protein